MFSTRHRRTSASDRIPQKDRKGYKEDMRYMQLARCRGTRIVCGPLESEFLLTESIREALLTCQWTMKRKSVLNRRRIYLGHIGQVRTCISPLTKTYASPELVIIGLTFMMTLTPVSASNDSVFVDLPECQPKSPATHRHFLRSP